MQQTLLLITIFLLASTLEAQEYRFRENINKDSLFNATIERLPKEKREEFTRTYKEGNETARNFLLFMLSMPKSSKKELIANYDNKKAEILKLKADYSKLVPANYVVEIEFEPASKIMTVAEQITIKVYTTRADGNKTSGREPLDSDEDLDVVSQNWNLQYGSKELEAVIKSIGWSDQTLSQIKKLLDSANCVSIENGRVATIGFARSGMGKYSYKLFGNSLTKKQREEYNNGCEYIYYKDNVVLEYGGGAVGPQCFERN